MGPFGAWIADFALVLFGPVSALFVPLLYVFARKLWLLVEEDDNEVEHSNQRWWRPVAMLALAMVLVSTVLSLWIDRPGGTLPASWGGLSGLLGAKAITSLAELTPDIAQGWIKLVVALVCLTAGTALIGKVFAKIGRA